MRTDSNLCRKESTVHWSAPNSLIRSYFQPCTNSTWRDESEAVAPIIWLDQTVDARKEEVFFPDLLITLRRHGLTEYSDEQICLFGHNFRWREQSVLPYFSSSNHSWWTTSATKNFANIRIFAVTIRCIHRFSTGTLSLGITLSYKLSLLM